MMNMIDLKQIKNIDVLVIGGGNAGLCAAISAAQKTQNVVVIEKASYNSCYAHSTTKLSFF